MFLNDQFQALKIQNSDIKFLDLATNARKEWDDVAVLQDEYHAKFLEESQKYNPPVLSHNPQATILSQPQEDLSFLSLNQKPQPPRKPLPAFDIYKENYIEQIKGENPDRELPEITQMIADMWTNEHQDVRFLYESRAKTAQEVYERECADYEAKYGKIIEIKPEDIALARRIRAQRF